MSNKLYQFYNTKLKKKGQPFALCKYHHSTYEPPAHLEMTLMKENTDELCNLCNLPWGSAGARSRLVSSGKRTKPIGGKIGG